MNTLKVTLAPVGALHRTSGFTLIELLTVIAIIGILAAITIPTVGKVRQSAQKSQCAGNLRQLALGVRLFSEDNQGRLPYSNLAASGGEARKYWYREIRNYVGKVDNSNVSLDTGTVTPLYLCPTDQDKVEFQRNNRGGNLVVSYLHMLPVPFTIREGGTRQDLILNLSRLTDPSRHPMLVDARDVVPRNYNTPFNNANVRQFMTTTPANAEPPTPSSTNLGFMHGSGANVAYYDGSVKYRQNPTWITMRGL